MNDTDFYRLSFGARYSDGSKAWTTSYDAQCFTPKAVEIHFTNAQFCDDAYALPGNPPWTAFEQRDG